MRILESAENYLETILILSRQNELVRSIDIVNELNFTKPSVSVAMKNLRENDYIVMDNDGYITLTEKGKKIAEEMYERHTILTNLLIHLGVEKETAADDACRIEHFISADSFEAIKKYMSNTNNK